MIGWSRGKR